MSLKGSPTARETRMDTKYSALLEKHKADIRMLGDREVALRDREQRAQDKCARLEEELTRVRAELVASIRTLNAYQFTLELYADPSFYHPDWKHLRHAASRALWLDGDCIPKGGN